DEIYKINNEGALWHYGKARFCVWQARRGDLNVLGDAYRHLNEAARLNQNWSRVPICRAEALELARQADEARGMSQMALDLGGRQPGVLERLVELLYDRGRYAQAEEALVRLEALRPLTPDLQRLAAEAFLQKPEPDFDSALKLAEKLVK